MSGLKKILIRGALWSAGGQMLSLLLVLVTNVWLTHLLSPKEFGQVGIIMFFVTVANVLTEGGLSGALIRKPNASKEDYSTVFIFNLCISVSLYIILLCSAPFIARFYKDSSLSKLLAFSGLILIINAFQVVQYAKLMSEQRFKHNAIYRITAVFIASAIGIFLAYRGVGVFALVIIQLLTASIMTVELWLFEGFSFSFKFNRKSFKELYSFGINTTIASVLNTAFENVYQLVLGKYFSLKQVGFYYQAKRLQEIPGNIINLVAQNVVFSSLSKIQDDKKKFASVFDRIFIALAALQVLCAACIYLYAEPIIYFVFGSKWMGSVLFMRLLAIATVFAQIELINRLIFKIFNKTKNLLKLEILKKIIQTITIIIGVYVMNIEVLLQGFIVSSIISCVLNYFYSRSIISSAYKGEFYKFVGLILWAVPLVFLANFIYNRLAVSYLLKLISLPVFSVVFIGGLEVLGILKIRHHIKMPLRKSNG